MCYDETKGYMGLRAFHKFTICLARSSPNSSFYTAQNFDDFGMNKLCFTVISFQSKQVTDTTICESYKYI